MQRPPLMPLKIHFLQGNISAFSQKLQVFCAGKVIFNNDFCLSKMIDWNKVGFKYSKSLDTEKWITEKARISSPFLICISVEQLQYYRRFIADLR